MTGIECFGFEQNNHNDYNFADDHIRLKEIQIFSFGSVQLNPCCNKDQGKERLISKRKKISIYAGVLIWQQDPI